MKIFEKSVTYLVDFGDRDLETILKDWNNSDETQKLLLHGFPIKKIKSNNEIITRSYDESDRKYRNEIEFYYSETLKTLEIKFVYKLDFRWVVLLVLGLVILVAIIINNLFFTTATFLPIGIFLFVILINLVLGITNFKDFKRDLEKLFFYQKLVATEI